MKTKQRRRYVYLVYCNPVKPLVYAVYATKKAALDYAESLIDYRREHAARMKYEFGFYGYFSNDTVETDFDKRERCILSVCLKIKDGRTPDQMSDDACLVQVIRRPVMS